ncbi:MAG: gluconate 2-dehydrogenase subunit 3 family protein [Sphingomonadales bacterium]|nr:gluconate 2-dehydrogenase subunit 3 family protein [Sphingomonadales bacterium]
MAERGDGGWDRREFVSAASLLALALGIPAAAVRLTVPEDQAPDDATRALFREVSQLVIPRTTTPGAGDAGTGDFVALALAHGLEGSRKPVPAAYARWQRTDGSLRYPAWLAAELNRRVGGAFVAAPEGARWSALRALDAEAHADGVAFHPWRTIKALVLTGYYTSQAGGARELRYEPVPGRWDADLPQTAQTRAISNDWTAVDFG